MQARAAPTEVPRAFPADRFLPDGDSRWPGHWSVLPVAWEDAGIQVDTDQALAQVRSAIIDMPAELRQVIVLHDVQAGSPADVQQALGISPEEERARLHTARGLVRARLERHLEGANP